MTFKATGGEVELSVWVADTEATRAKGLMNIYSMDPGQGMIFVWNAPVTGGFWMKNTHIPLSIAFIDEDLRIIDIQDMQPDTLDDHKPSSPYRYAVEVNQGYFTGHGIAVGDSVALEGVQNG